MNRSAELLAFFSKSRSAGPIVITPNAPPVTRTPAGISVALNIVLDAADVMDTLTALKSRARSADSVALDAAGTFAFSLPEVGRIRVHYATQRGSKIITMTCVPFTVPILSSVTDNVPDLAAILDCLCTARGGLFAVYGTSALSNAILAYSLLSEVNRKARRIICIVERALTFLMAHGNSIIVQSEVSTDVKSFDEGVMNVFPFEPDILYVGDIWPGDDVPRIVQAIDSGILVLVSSVSMDGPTLLQRFESRSRGGTGLTAAIEVRPQKEGGRLSVDVTLNKR